VGSRMPFTAVFQKLRKCATWYFPTIYETYAVIHSEGRRVHFKSTNYITTKHLTL
jgi:hypothetical protein